ANPILWAGCTLLLFRRWRAVTVAGCLALYFGLNVAALFEPRAGPWSCPLVGYYLWIGSMVLLACSGLFRGYFVPEARATPEDERIVRLAAQQRALAAQLADLRGQGEG